MEFFVLLKTVKRLMIDRITPHKVRDHEVGLLGSTVSSMLCEWKFLADETLSFR